MTHGIAHPDDLLIVGWLREADPYRGNFRPRQIISANSLHVLYGRRVRRAYVTPGAYSTPRAAEFFAVLEHRVRLFDGSEIRSIAHWAGDQQRDLDELNAAFERSVAAVLEAANMCASETSA